MKLDFTTVVTVVRFKPVPLIGYAWRECILYGEQGRATRDRFNSVSSRTWVHDTTTRVCNCMISCAWQYIPNAGRDRICQNVHKWTTIVVFFSNQEIFFFFVGDDKIGCVTFVWLLYCYIWTLMRKQILRKIPIKINALSYLSRIYT